MSLLATTIAWICIALEVLLLSGLIVRVRVRQCYLLFVLTLAWLASALVAGLCPSCMTWNAWIVTELGHALLAFLLALELVWRAFRQVPRAWWWSRVAVVAAIVCGATLVRASWPGPLSLHVIPWVLGALACLYVGLWVVAQALDMPQEPLHRAVLAGLSPYLIVYAITWALTTDDTVVANTANPLMFMAALVVLVQAAWQPEGHLAAHADTVRWLFPWRS